jgi:hypothetical protein
VLPLKRQALITLLLRAAAEETRADELQQQQQQQQQTATATHAKQRVRAGTRCTPPHLFEGEGRTRHLEQYSDGYVSCHMCS